MKNIRFFLSENFHFYGVKFSVYLNRHVFVMKNICSGSAEITEYNLLIPRGRANKKMTDITKLRLLK